VKATVVGSFFIRLIDRRRRAGLALAAATALLCPAVLAASAPALTVVHSFTALPTPPSRAINLDGANPASCLIQGSDGNFYGTTQDGGPGGAGTIFELGTNGSLTGLYSFPGITNSDGVTRYNIGPNDLTRGSNQYAGYLYGTTQRGGNLFGSVFALSPKLVFTDLHDFSPATNLSASGSSLTNADGSDPTGALVPGPDGNFYGTTQSGGANGTGTIFQLTPAGGFTSLYSFSALDDFSDNSDGATPNGLVLGSNGAFYGTTQGGGVNGAGTVFQFSPGGGVTPLYSFDPNSSDPDLVQAALVQGPNGNFYGTSEFGGSADSGTVFEVTPSGVVTVLYSFSGENDGGLPSTPLTLAPDGNFCGTTGGAGSNETGTLYIITPGGSFSTMYSFSALKTNSENSDGAYPSAALTVGSDGNMYGSCQNGGAGGTGTIFRFSLSRLLPPSLLPSITKQPAKLSGLAGSTVTLSVTAKSSASFLNYQWLKNGTYLSNAGDITGATTTNLVFSPLRTGDAGSYAVVIANGYGSITSSVAVLTVTLDKTVPTVTITSPAANARTNAPVFKGTATDNVMVTNVVLWLTNVSSHSNFTSPAALTRGSGAASNWSIVADPWPGTNIVSAQSVDFSGNTSKVVSLSFFYKVTNQLGVVLAGDGGGTTTGTASAKGDTVPAPGAFLNLGESYSITAISNKTSLFSNWVVSAGDSMVLSNSPTLNFIMQSNLVLTANFTSNFFLGAAGTYNGLFYTSNGVSEETAGLLSGLALGSNGVYSAKLLVAGKSYSLTGKFDVSGHAAAVAGTTALPGGPLKIELTLDRTIPQIVGTVSNTLWTANLLADLGSVPGKGLPSAEYTILLSPTTNVPAASPPGDGYILVTNHAGAVTLSVTLADGTPFTQNVPVSKAGDLPVYYSIYGNTGLLLGWINLTNLNGAPSTNALAWIKKAARSPALYANGFTNILAVQGAPWTNPPAKTPALFLTNGELVISNANIFLNFTNVIVSNNNALLNLGKTPTNSLTGLIAPKTGLLTVTFGNGKGKATTTGTGAVLQNQASAGGYFLTTTNAGAISLQPPQ
jgi:uncharacterized repeat protein (TIGR03803 family)